MNIMTTEDPTDQSGNIFKISLNKTIRSSFIFVYSSFTDLICVEESLMSLEKLDRASPDLWPEQSKCIII